MSRRALVTGGAGFIGSHLVSRLIQHGWYVRVLDNFATGCIGNLRSVQADVEIIDGDIRDRDLCHTACRGIDSVFHLAGLASVATSISDPIQSHDITSGGTLNMLLAARDRGVRRFILSSSASVYGNSDRLPTVEDQPLAPQSPYAADKAGAEFYCHNFHTLFGLETVVLRYFNVFGPRQSAKSGYAAVVPLFVQAALSGTTPKVFGDGLQTRDFVYVENVASANLLAAEASSAAGHKINIAGGESMSLLDLLAIFEKIIGAAMEPEFRPARPGEVRHSRADISAARNLLGFDPRVSVADGLRATLEATRSLSDLRPLAGIY